MSLIESAVKLLHKKQDEAFKNLTYALGVTTEIPPKPNGTSILQLLDWANKRWGNKFIEEEYKIRSILHS